MVYVPFVPTVKLPVWLFAMIRSVVAGATGAVGARAG